MSGKFTTATAIRFSKILLVVFFGFYVLVAAFGNVTDSAFRITAFILGTLIFVTMKND
ncbi:MAG: hypothetical protein JJU13_04220 [Balneolaceae bacterium]|nr:hypothetical protein [Balneolaceae bacterium]